jgi:methyl-accepting chemotaxis protein
MQWFYNLKIAAKLLSGFILVAVIAGVIGLIGISKIRQIEEADTAMYELNTKPMEPILATAVSFQRIRVNYRELVLDKTAEERNKHAARIKELGNSINEKLPEIEKSLKSPETKKAYAEIKENLSKFEPLLNKIVNLAMEGKSEEAVAYMRSQSVSVCSSPA